MGADQEFRQGGNGVARVAGGLAGMTGAAVVATIVVCLSAAWALGEMRGTRHSLEQHPLQAPWFYGAFALLLLAAALTVVFSHSLVRLSIATAVLNAVLLPLVLGFLFWLARSELPAGLRLQGRYAVAVGILFLLTGGLGLYAGVTGALHG